MWKPFEKVFEFENNITGVSVLVPGQGPYLKGVRGRRPSSVKELTGLALEVEKIYSASQKSTPKALPFTPYLIPNRSHVIYRSPP